MSDYWLKSVLDKMQYGIGVFHLTFLYLNLIFYRPIISAPIIEGPSYLRSSLGTFQSDFDVQIASKPIENVHHSVASELEKPELQLRFGIGNEFQIDGISKSTSEHHEIVPGLINTELKSESGMMTGFDVDGTPAENLNDNYLLEGVPEFVGVPQELSDFMNSQDYFQTGKIIQLDETGKIENFEDWKAMWQQELQNIEFEKAYELESPASFEFDEAKKADTKNKKNKPWPIVNHVFGGKLNGHNVRTNILKPSRNLGKLATLIFNPQFNALDINARVLSDRTNVGAIVADIMPRMLSMWIRPEILGPRITAALVHLWIQPRLLNVQIQPEVLNPEIFTSLLFFEARPMLLTTQIQPCVLGPEFRMQLLRLQFVPRMLHAAVSPEVMCPFFDMSLLGIRGNPNFLTSSDSPRILSDRYVMDLLKVDLV